MRILSAEELARLTPEELKEVFRPREFAPEELQEAYRLARAAFTADDLQRYTELDEGIPFDEVLAELEELQKQIERDCNDQPGEQPTTPV